MKKLILLLALIVFAVASCKEKKPTEYTILGDYTAYSTYMERLNGKVASVIETNYWAVPEDKTYIKGNKITEKELDSLNYTSDFEAKFDEAGDLVSCTAIDENKKAVWKWELIKDNNVYTTANYTYLDTLRGHQKLECNENGEIIKVSQYPADADTIFNWNTQEKTSGKDTIITQWYDYKGNPTSKVLNLYNNLGQFTGYQSYNNDGTLRGASEIVYNDHGLASQITFFDKEKKQTTVNHFTYEYDKMGNWVKVICKDDAGFALIAERVYTYFE
jgi:hypothetical protein